MVVRLWVCCATVALVRFFIVSGAVAIAVKLRFVATPLLFNPTSATIHHY